METEEESVRTRAIPTNTCEELEEGEIRDPATATVTIFLDNLSKDVNAEIILKDLLTDVQVRRIYVSRKRRANKPESCFGFVEVGEARVAMGIIRTLRGKEYKGKRLFASVAKYQRSSGLRTRPSARLRQDVPVPRRSNTVPDRQSTQNSQSIPDRTSITISKDEEEEMENSLVISSIGTTPPWIEYPDAFDGEKLRIPIRKVKMLVVFDDNLSKTSAIQEVEHNRSVNLAGWDYWLTTELPPVWLQCSGLPITTWKRKHLQTLLGNWGEVQQVYVEQLESKICGSLRKASYNRGLLRIAMEISSKSISGLQIEYADIAALPLINTDLEVNGGFPPVVEAFRQKISGADAFLFGSPEYNYSVAPPLKNAIDWASRAPNAWADKPAAILSAGGGFGGGRSQYHLRQIGVFLDLHFINKPEFFLNAFQPPQKFDSDGNLIDDEAKERIKSVLLALQAFTLRLKE